MGKARPNTKKHETLEAWLERDLSAEAAAGRLEPTYERDELVAQLARILDGGRSPLLYGEPGVGKTALVHELARLAALGRGPRALRGRRLVQLSLRRRLSGLKRPIELGPALARLCQHLIETQDADPVVPFFRDLYLAWEHEIEGQLVSLAYRLKAPILGEGDPESIEAMLEYAPELEESFMPVPVPEPGAETVQRIVERWNQALPRSKELGRPFFDAEALEMALGLSHRFLVRSRMPRKILEPLGQIAETESRLETIGRAEVVRRFCEGYGLPRILVDPDVSLDLVDLEWRLANRVVGQREAVRTLVETIGRVKAGLADPRRPFGVFLFVGPTGVGKTHLARSVAELLFDDPERVIRLNMADFPDEGDADTLFGEPDAERLALRRGILTQRILGHPFAVLLLDEFEKASPRVHDRFLQLFDEGAFVNGAAETITCRSLLVVATSNVGGDLWRGGPLGFAAGPGAGEGLRRAVDERLARTFRFEFLNRLDGIVRFRPLSRSDVALLARREIEALEERAGVRRLGARLEAAPELVAWVAEHGYDAQRGARSLRRAVEQGPATAVASLLLSGRVERGGRVRLELEEGRVVARALSPLDPQAEERERILREADRVLAAGGARVLSRNEAADLGAPRPLPAPLTPSAVGLPEHARIEPAPTLNRLEPEPREDQARLEDGEGESG